MIKKILALILIFMQMQLFANLKEIFVVSENWEDYTNRDGSGVYFELVKLIYEPIGIKVKIKIYPYKRTLQMVEKKQADVWLGSYIDEEDYAIYPKHYFDKDVIVAMFKKDKIKNFKGIENLRDKRVGWLRGYGFDEYINIPMKINERNNIKAILNSLDKDRIDIYLDDKYDMANALEKNNFDYTAYERVELLKFKLYPAFRNDSKGEEFLRIWEERMKILIKNGSLKKFYIKHTDLELYYELELLDD